MVSSLSSFIESRATPRSGADAHSSSANRNNNDNSSSESYRRQAPYYLSSFREQRGERAVAATPASMATNTSFEDSNGERHNELMDERILNLIAASAPTATTTVSTATEVACRHHHPRCSSRSIMTLPSVESISSNTHPSPNNLKAPPAHSYNVHLNSDKQRALHQITNENKAAQIWKYLPLQWQHDKAFILEALHNHSAPLPHKSDFERTFPQSLRFDKDIVLAFCHRPDFVLKTKTDTVVEGICTTEQDDTSSQNQEGDDYHGLYYERHLFVPGCLTNDKDVMLAYCSKIPRSLQDCSEELCDDPDVVDAAITHCSGLELQYASIRLQKDIKMVKLACQNHGRSLEFCPPLSTTRQLLIEDRDFMLNVVLSNPGGGSMWKILPKHLQENDDELILRALQNGLLLRDVPTSYVSVDFLQQAIRNNCKLYLQLNTINNNQATLNWQQHPTLAFEAVLSEDSTPAVHALALGPDGCPTLRENRQVFIAICKRGSLDLLQDLLGHTVVTTNTNNNNNNDLAEEAALQDMFDAHGIHGQLLPLPHPRAVVLHAPGLVTPPEPPVHQVVPRAFHRRSRFCDDMDIMKLAVTRNPSFFSAASLRLQAEPELILASITRSSAWNTLKTVPWSIQRQHPEITIKAINLCDSRNLRYLPTHIPEEMWMHHRDICMAWIRRGGRVLDVFERMLRTDPEMGLLVAKHNWSEFYKVGDRWLNDRDFVLQALDLDGRILRFASVNLRQDFDIMLRAVANYFNNMPLGIQHQPTTPSVSQALSGILDLDSLKREIQRLLDLHQLYLNEFLRAISVKTPRVAPALRSQLTMLDRGIETSQAFKRLIAEYLGVPVGAKLAMLRKAHENLQRPPPSTSTRSSIFDATWDDPLLGRPDDGGAMERHAIRRFRFMARRHRELLNINEGNNHGGGDDDDDDADGFLGVPTRRTRELEMQERIAATAAGRPIGATRFPPPLQTPGALFHPFAGMNGNDNSNNNMDTLRTRAERMRSHRGSARAVMMAQDFADATEQRAQHQREAFREQRMHELDPYGLGRIETRVGRRLPEETDATNNDNDAPNDDITNNNSAATTTGAITRTRNVGRVNFGRESMTMFQENNLRQQQPILAEFLDWGPTVANPARAMSMSNASSTVSIEVGSTERDLLEAERRRQSDEMLARLEARNARSRAAEQARAFEEGGIHAVWAINAEQQVNDPPVPLLDPRIDRGLTVPRSRRRAFGTRPFLRVDHEDDDIDDDDDDDLVDVDDDALFSDMLYGPDGL